MNITCIISNKKYAGKTFLASHIISSFQLLNMSVCYYKPFIMGVKDSKLYDIDCIKTRTYLNASDIFVSYASSGIISPMHSINIQIDERDITDTIYENSLNYDNMILESLPLYEPIKSNYNFYDMILDIKLENKLNIIPVIEYDENIIHSIIEQVELFFNKKLKIPFIVINVKRNLFISNDIIEYIKREIAPIKIYIIEFSSENNQKIEDIKYSDLIKHLISLY